jgi:hypothetical protein
MQLPLPGRPDRKCPRTPTHLHPGSPGVPVDLPWAFDSIASMLGSMQRAAHALAWMPVLCFLLPACGSSQAASTGPAAPGVASSEVTAPPGDAPLARGPWETCYSTFAPTGDASADLARLVRDCGATGGMRAVSAVRLGQQAEQDPVDRYTFEVPRAGKCYRVYGASDAAVQDLDLLLRGPSGDALVADVTHDSWPVLPPQGPLCFSEPGLYMLEVSVFKGAGRYALQVWGR